MPSSLSPARTIVAASLFAIAISGGRTPAVEGPSLESARRVYLQMGEQRLDRELVHMQLSMRISDDQTQLLRDAGRTALKEWINEQPPQVWFSEKQIPQPVLDAVMQKADRRLGVVVANRYRQDLILERQLSQSIGVDGFAVILDQVLALNQKQDAQIRELAAANWNPKWLNRVLTSGPERINILRPALAELKPELKSILTRRQLRVLQTKHPSSSRAIMKDMPPSEIKDAAEQFRKNSRAELEGIMSVRIDEIQDLCGLNANQLKSLEQTGMQVVNQLAGELGNAFEELKVKGPGAAAPQAWDIISSNFFLLIEQNSDWQSAIKRTLSPQQQNVWQARQAKRKKRWSESAIGGIAALLGQQMKFTAKQTQDLMNIMRSEIDPTNVWSTNDHYRELVKITDSKFDGLFSDVQQAEFAKLIADLRKQN